MLLPMTIGAKYPTCFNLVENFVLREPGINHLGNTHSYLPDVMKL